MTERLIQCAACSRHVKSCDAACPFCGAPVCCVPAPVREPYRRMAAAAALAASVVACTSTSPVPAYGGPGVVDYDASPSGEDAGAAPADGGTVDAAAADGADGE